MEDFSDVCAVLVIDTGWAEVVPGTLTYHRGKAFWTSPDGKLMSALASRVIWAQLVR